MPGQRIRIDVILLMSSDGELPSDRNVRENGTADNFEQTAYAVLTPRANCTAAFAVRWAFCVDTLVVSDTMPKKQAEVTHKIGA